MQPSAARHLLPGASRSGPVSPLMILCGSHCARSRPEINPAAKMVGTSKPKTASAMSGSAADVRNRGTAAASWALHPHRAGGPMKRRSALTLAAAGTTIVLAIAACSGGKPGPQETPDGYNAALNTVVNASSHKGGTIVFDYGTAPDSTDPGNTYHAEMWNLVRLYGRTLVTYKSAPGAAGMQLMPDLATSLGKVSDNGLTWTYHLKTGIRYERSEERRVGKECA